MTASIAVAAQTALQARAPPRATLFLQPSARQPCRALGSGSQRSSSSAAPRRGRTGTCRRLPPAAASKQPGGAASKPKHFLRPSLVATGFTEPADVLQHCIALFRKCDLAALRQYLPDSCTETLDRAAAAAAAGSGAQGSGSGGQLALLPPPPADEPWLQVPERGPLAPLAGILDVGARRVLPGHLLRRSQVLSTLRPGPDTFQQRISLTACTGETSVFEWQLRWQPAGEEQQPAGPAGAQESSSGNGASNDSSAAASMGQDAAGGSSSNGSGASPEQAADSTTGGGQSGGRWVLESVRRDASCDLPLPTTPHPKASPEAIVRAQLAALQQRDVFGASCFSMRAGRGATSRKTSLVHHHDALRAKLQGEPYSLLLGHAGVQLGGAVLPAQREMLQDVSVLAADGTSARFVWRLTMASHSCWMASGILPAQEAAAQLQQAPPLQPQPPAA